MQYFLRSSSHSNRSFYTPIDQKRFKLELCIFSRNPKDQEAFAAIRNQYERALWLHLNAPTLFDEALNARQADVFRQSASCYSGFIAP